MNHDTLIKRMIQARVPMEQVWQDIVRFFSPYKANLFQRVSQKVRIANNLYHTVGVDSARIASEGLYGHLVSPALNWFSLETDSEDVDVKDWVDIATTKIYEALKSSNFYSEVLDLILDGLTIGTATLYFEENLGEHTIYYRSISPGMIWISENYHKEINTVLRKDFLTSEQANDRFGLHERNAERIPFLHLVIPNGDNWDSIWMKARDNKVVKQGSYNYFPYITWRCIKNISSPYGFSPSYVALPIVKSLNKIRKSLLQAAELAVHPPINVPINADIDLSPRGMNYYSDPSQIISPINLGGEYPIGEDRETKLEQEVKEIFHVPYFLLFAQEPKVMSATEVMARQGEQAAVFGHLLGRFLKVLDRVVQGAFIIESRAGRIPMPPVGLSTLAIKYYGPLALAQEKLFKTRGVQEAIASVAPVIQLHPEAATNVDWDYLIRYLIQSSDVPAKTLLSQKAVEQVKAMDAAKQALTEQGAEAAPGGVLQGLQGGM